MKAPTQKVRERPAETVAGAGGIVFVVGRALGWPDDVTNAIAVIVAATPAVVTFIVELVRGGTDGGGA
jgi:hypothetical protein